MDFAKLRGIFPNMHLAICFGLIPKQALQASVHLYIYMLEDGHIVLVIIKLMRLHRSCNHIVICRAKHTRFAFPVLDPSSPPEFSGALPDLIIDFDFTIRLCMAYSHNQNKMIRTRDKSHFLHKCIRNLPCRDALNTDQVSN